jgi:hypothetical protein
MLLVMENTPLAITPATVGGTGTISLIGGIMTDGSIAAPTGAGKVNILPETDHLHLIQIAPRRAWIETYLDYTNGNL